MKFLAALLLLLNVTGFVHDGSAEIIFPQAIRFVVNLTIPASNVASAQLTITPQGSAPIVIPVDVDQATVTSDDQGSQLAYIWRIPVDDTPSLFSSIAYQWSLTATDGGTGTLEDSLIFADPLVDWVHSPDSSARFSVSGSRTLAPLINSLPQIHDLLEKNTGRPLDENWLIYDTVGSGCTPSTDDPDKLIARGQDGTTVDCDPGIEDTVLKGYRVLSLPVGASADDFVVTTLVNDAYAPLWASKDVPAWFSDGLAQFYQPTPKNSLLPPAQQAARSNSLYSLEQMETTQTSPLWRAQSFGMILYIVNQIGVQGFADLARVNGNDFNAAYQQAMSVPLTGLIPAWQQWIFTRSAASDYGITPYQPPTITPTVTLSPSPSATATSTLTLTPTLTPTPTITPFGFRTTYVPPPTLTPSETLPPPPPTVTPRPPGSLPTVTPIPTPVQSAAADRTVQAGAATFLIFLLVVFVFLFIRLGNRR